MKPKVSLIVIVLVLMNTLSMFSQQAASKILGNAIEKAKTENKHVFIICHASWCGWCKKMDQNMNHKACHAFFEKNYVIEHLVVHESADKKHLENPEADALLTKYKGLNSGIPFWLIFDSNGNLLADSLDDHGQNLGCPATEKEISLFIAKLKETSSLTQKELDIIAGVFAGV